ncbi:MAG TPA: KH domain-containing protein [Terriglobales bacterium]|nr:KH domain-containing protein [Terriglobales bacterium]
MITNTGTAPRQEHPNPQQPGNGHATESAGADEHIRAMVERIAHSLVDVPDKVKVQAVCGEQVVVLELSVAPEDLGKVIGKQGRTARSIRILLGAAGMKLKRRFTLEIIE